MKLSIVATLYQSQAYIKEFCDRASNAANELVGDDYEIILVNDGSPDNSFNIAYNLAKERTEVVLVDLSRNFGHHKAMMTGLMHAKGDFIFLIDSDLEESPEWLVSFYNALKIGNCESVFGVQSTRKGGWFERWSGKFFYFLIKSVFGIHLPESQVTARLMTRRFVDSLILHQEREMIIGGLYLLAGYDQLPFSVVKLSHSETTYTMRHKLAMLVNVVTSFSAVPLKIVFNFGLLIFVSSILFVTYLVINWLFFTKAISGWVSIIASIWLLGGAIILILGLLGIYLSKIFIETKQRPYTLVKGVHGRD